MVTSPAQSTAPLPRSFPEYLRSFGPGLVVVLTWLGAGDIVEMGTAGANFGYSLMWVLVAAILMRWVMVSVIARYQLCNPRGEHVLDGLCRINRLYAPLLLFAAILMGHLYGSYMTRGIGEACRNMTGVGTIWSWALFWNLVGLVLVLRPAFQRVELLFKVFLVLLSVAFIGTSLWVGINPAGIAEGLVSIEVPAQHGDFHPLLIAAGMIGAVGGSLMNLVYPYFLANKGWRGPQYRRVQFYDFLLAMIVMLLLNLSVWTLGAETLHPEGATIKTMDDLPWLLGTRLGQAGALLFYLGIFAAVFTSLVGHALGLGCLGSHSWLRCRSRDGDLSGVDFRNTRVYRGIATWCLLSPLIWTIPGMPDFITLTLVVNALQVVLLPLIAGGLWWLTSHPAHIGRQFCNRWWEHTVLAVLLGLSLYGGYTAVVSVVNSVRDWNRVEPNKSHKEAETHLLSYGDKITLTRDQRGHVIDADLSGLHEPGQHDRPPLAQQTLAALRTLDHLKSLNLSHTGLRPADLRYLQGHGELRLLKLHGNDLLPDDIQRLQLFLPECDIRIGSSRKASPP